MIRKSLPLVICTTAVSTGLLACSDAHDRSGAIKAFADQRDPAVMLERCFNGNPDGECTRFEALFGVDPRTSEPCLRIGDKLNDCELLVQRAKSTASHRPER